MKEKKVMKRSLNYCIRYFLLSIGLLHWNSAGAESTETLLEELQTLRQEVEQRRAKLRQEVERQRAELQRELQLLKGALGAEDISRNTTESAFMPAADTMSREELESELRILQEEIEQVKEMLAAKQESAASPAALPFQLKGQVRTRLEWTDNDFNSGDANLVHFLRTRIGIAAQPHEHTGVFVQLQDARQWGEETNTLADGSGDNIDFHQAYIKIDQFLAPPLSLKLGRQEMVYGGQRLIGAVGWHNIGRAFDAVKLRYGAKSYVDLFNAKLAESGIRDRNFYGLYGHLAASRHSWEPYLLFEQDKNSGVNLKRATLGLYGKGVFTGASGHAFGFELESALQRGKLGVQDVAAFMGTGALTYVSPHWRKHKFTLGLDFLSGDDDPTDADYKVFDTLFATNHKFYGFMDFFLNIPVHTGQGGLLDFMLKGEMKTAANTKLAVHLHHFALAEGQDKTLGQELDAIVTHKYNKAYSIQWGGLVFLPGDAMEAIKGGNDLAFKTYLQTLANF